MLIGGLLSPQLLLRQQTLADENRLTPCSGHNPETNSWAMLRVNLETPQAVCPDGMALISHAPVFGPLGFSGFGLAGNCCPVPKGTVATGWEFVERTCRDGSVLRGAKIGNLEAAKSGREKPVYRLICSKVFRNAAHLGPPTQAYAIEYGDIMMPWWSDENDPNYNRRTTWGAIPDGIRLAVGRVSKTEWLSSICVGVPWGSFLTSVGDNGCRDFTFREIIPGAENAEDQKSQ